MSFLSRVGVAHRRWGCGTPGRHEPATRRPLLCHSPDRLARDPDTSGASPNSMTSGFGGPGWNAACRTEMNSLHKLPLINFLYVRYGHIPVNTHTHTDTCIFALTSYMELSESLRSSKLCNKNHKAYRQIGLKADSKSTVTRNLTKP